MFSCIFEIALKLTEFPIHCMARSFINKISLYPHNNSTQIIGEYYHFTVVSARFKEDKKYVTDTEVSGRDEPSILEHWTTLVHINIHTDIMLHFSLSLIS